MGFLSLSVSFCSPGRSIWLRIDFRSSPSTINFAGGASKVKTNSKPIWLNAKEFEKGEVLKCIATKDEYLYTCANGTQITVVECLESGSLSILSQYSIARQIGMPETIKSGTTFYLTAHGSKFVVSGEDPRIEVIK
jgi:hypothetical protein